MFELAMDTTLSICRLLTHEGVVVVVVIRALDATHVHSYRGGSRQTVTSKHLPTLSGVWRANSRRGGRKGRRRAASRCV